MDQLSDILEYLALGIDIAGLSLMVWGFAKSFFHLFQSGIVTSTGERFVSRSRLIRCELGTYLLLGLEFMILSDIVQSALSRSLVDLAFLGAIVLIRTTIGFFLGRELAELAELVELRETA